MRCFASQASPPDVEADLPLIARAGARTKSWPRHQGNLSLGRAQETAGSGKIWPLASPPLAAPPAFQHDDLTPRKILGQLLRHFLGNAQKPLAPVHLLPDILGADAGGDLQHDQVIDQVGALLDRKSV